MFSAYVQLIAFPKNFAEMFYCGFALFFNSEPCKK